MSILQRNYLPSFLFLSLLLLTTPFCSIENKNSHSENTPRQERKQRGIHIFGKVDSLSFPPLVKNNIEWVTYVPWSDQANYDSPSLRNYIPKDSINESRKDSLWRTQITLAHDAGLKVFLKPHVWIYKTTGGKWRSDIFPTNEENWELWKANYREWILYYAQVAEKYDVELFCIGTEFTRLALEKPEFWKQLIREVRNIYSGQLTYAANWYQEFEKITFWDQLDFVGIQAYFPLVNHNNPTTKQISKGWKKHFSSINRVYKKFNKPVLFTELGYKSTEDSAIEPWTWMSYDLDILNKLPVSTETQVNCYQAFFDTVWEQEWMAGVHLWSWNTEHQGGMTDHDFTPKNKPAEKTITKGFGKK